jgi:hypothetical protein
MRDGLAQASLNGKQGFLDNSMRWTIAPIYNEADDCGELIKVVADNMESYFDRNGKPVAGFAAGK